MSPPAVQIDTQQLPSVAPSDSPASRANVTIRLVLGHNEGLAGLAAPARQERIGAPIFVEELKRFAAAGSDLRCAAIAERLAMPLRVGVTGGRGVGRSTVARALAHAGVSVASPADADLIVRVLADAVTPEDRAAIDTADRPVLAVLNKADLIATTAPGRHPGGPSDAARVRCAQLAERAGIPVEPLVGLLAVAELDDAAWAALHDDRPLIPALDRFGVRQTSAAIRRGATRTDVAALLHDLSGIDAVVDTIGVLGAPLRYQRVLDAVAELELMAVADERVAEFLARDDTVVARMMVAIDAVEAVGLTVDRGHTAAAHLNRARQWQRRAPGVPRACGGDIVRGSLRLWSQVGGSV